MDMALARADRTSQRFYSLSRQIHRSRASYYEILERTQKRLSLDATEWVIWFLQRMTEALDASESVLHIVRSKHAFWRKNEDSQLNERQTKVVNLLLDGDFIGKLQTSKYAKLAKCSVPTAFRDLDELVAKGVLQMEGTGRATNYVLAEL